ncbi:kinase-like domain-containing protein [Achaetomium macrosporum]|uniref:non-specific serine/threonine protein kinase n=1 Tax=Achaetomium macrosporum TaxID=79813 RepID=A0AAN7CEB4_9PEZI|nr:kinase-like domain-containing protein [Achaetomium macrosporum]
MIMDTFEFAPATVRSPEAYGLNAYYNRKRCHQMARDFFKNAVERARHKHDRQKELAQRLENPALLSKREQLWMEDGMSQAKYIRFLRTKEGEKYISIKMIGKGRSGEVKLVREKLGGHVYALKRLAKGAMISNKRLTRIRTERDDLFESDSEWVVRLHTTFQDNTSFYLLMDFLPGGDLKSLLIKHQALSEDVTRFYAAEIPDKIRIDAYGHIKLADFGLSKSSRKDYDSSSYRELLQQPASGNGAPNRNLVNLEEISLTVNSRDQINKWQGFSRSPSYSAVESPRLYPSRAVVGQGIPTPYRTYRKIINWQDTFSFPDDIQLHPNAIHLIPSLVRDEETRLGRKGGATEIKSHPFFAGVSFDTLRHSQAPFQPQLTSDKDTSNFLPVSLRVRDRVMETNDAGTG